MRHFWTRPETLFSLAVLFLGALGFLFLGSLVAEPKVLFGRSLTAITPSLFPSIVLALLFLLSGLHVLSGVMARADDPNEGRLVGWRRGAVFFGVMTVYALLMEPIGFILSSALTIVVLSWFIGNRNVLQIALLAALAPVLLYIGATRLLAVSLPELVSVQLAIAKLFGG
jgi:putative tricarboxylic transport membrane protein